MEILGVFYHLIEGGKKELGHFLLTQFRQLLVQKEIATTILIDTLIEDKVSLTVCDCAAA